MQPVEIARGVDLLNTPLGSFSVARDRSLSGQCHLEAVLG
jgi:hypothetical protein